MKLIPLFASGLLFALSSCSEEKEANDQSILKKDEDLTTILLESAPDKPLGIAEIRKSAKPGETVTFSGMVMGKKVVFMDSRAVMTLGDPSKMTPCPPDEGCETPWDVCCDDVDVVNASIVTVQVVDKNGKVLKTGLRGLGGIKELSSLTVTGEVAKGSNAENMLVNATGIFVQPKS